MAARTLPFDDLRLKRRSPMTTATLTQGEDFYCGLFNAAIEEGRPVGPLAKIALNTLLTETDSHVGAEELKGSKATDGNRFVLHLAVSVLCDRYSSEVVGLILSLDNGHGPSNAH